MDARNLVPTNMSIEDFCHKSRDLYDADPASFVRFALTGRYGNKQAVVDPILNSVPDDERLGVVRDYDSLLGIDKDIKITCALTVFPVSKKEDVLTKNIHIHHSFTSSKASFFKLNFNNFG